MALLVPVALLLAVVTGEPQDGKTTAQQLDSKIAAARQLARSIDSSVGSIKDDQLVSDAGFLRRVYLDLIGRIPTIAETTAFEKETAADKRGHVIDRLIDSDDFVDLCARFWEYNWMGNYRDFRGRIGDKDVDPVLKSVYPRFHKWVKGSIKDDANWNKVIGLLIAGMGEMKDEPAALYKVNLFGEGDFHEYFSDKMSRAFFGIRITCARCHDHPFDRWTMDDYWGMAAFSARVKAKIVNKEGKGEPTDFDLWEDPKGEVSMPSSGKITKPKFLFGGDCPPGMMRMQALAQHTVATGSAQVDANTINRVWAWLMGRGFVEPVDDWNQRNKVIQASALGTVKGGWKQNGRSMKFLWRAICNTRYYQREYTGGGVGPFKSAMRPMTGEQLLSSLVTAGRGDRGAAYAETNSQWGALREELIPIFGINNEWTEITVLPGNTRQVLMMRNSRFVGGLVVGSLMSRLQGSDTEKLDTVFRALLTRPATAGEQARYAKAIKEGLNWDDIVWTLANSAEFMLRH